MRPTVDEIRLKVASPMSRRGVDVATPRSIHPKLRERILGEIPEAIDLLRRYTDGLAYAAFADNVEK